MNFLYVANSVCRTEVETTIHVAVSAFRMLRSRIKQFFAVSGTLMHIISLPGTCKCCSCSQYMPTEFSPWSERVCSAGGLCVISQLHTSVLAFIDDWDWGWRKWERLWEPCCYGVCIQHMASGLQSALLNVLLLIDSTSYLCSSLSPKWPAIHRVGS